MNYKCVHRFSVLIFWQCVQFLFLTHVNYAADLSAVPVLECEVCKAQQARDLQQNEG